MKKQIIIALAATISLSFNSFAQQAEIKTAFDNYRRYYADGQKVKDAEKEKSIEGYRKLYSRQAYRAHSLNSCKLSAQQCIDQLTEQGQFADMVSQEQTFRDNKDFRSPYSAPQYKVGLFVVEAYNRLWKIAEAYRKGEITKDEALSDKYLKAILHYGTIEAGRPNNAPRFHESCFALPTAAVNTYFCFLKEMEAVENGTQTNPQMVEVCDMLKAMALQAWTQPMRQDATDENVVQIERFRNHVWWVGGNALAYRSLFPVAIMYRSIPMVDLLSEVSRRGISTTSQSTYDDAFWTEGFTADGAGWGHGMQCLIWGYPIDGTSNALAMLSTMKGSPWAKQLDKENTDALMGFMRGGNWYYYKGYQLPCLDRQSFVYQPSAKPIRSLIMIKSMLNDWSNSFTAEELSELKQLQKEAQANNITMSGYPDGVYNGTRWFFNNDDLIKKNPDYHIIVNMSSVRCDGLESADVPADGYNFFMTDGMTLLQKKGNEYHTIMGGWDVTASPGVTAREGMEKLTSITNWRGFCSKHNFAAAATNGGENAAAGYIFEKMNASTKDGVNDKAGVKPGNEIIYGVKAHKSYFMLGDYMVALGAGVTNLTPNVKGAIRTTIDQTAWQKDVTTLHAGVSKPVSQGVQSMISPDKKPLWVIQQDGFAYAVLPQYTSDASFNCEVKAADWVKFNKSNKGKKGVPAEARILRLWANHGEKPVDDTYGYVVYAGKGMPAVEFPFTVLRNDTLVQAITSSDNKVVEAVFYKSNSELKAPKMNISVTAPCALLVEQKGKGYTITATDAQMNTSLKEIVVTINGTKVVIPMPQGELCGKPASVNVDKIAAKR